MLSWLCIVYIKCMEPLSFDSPGKIDVVRRFPKSAKGFYVRLGRDGNLLRVRSKERVKVIGLHMAKVKIGCRLDKRARDKDKRRVRAPVYKQMFAYWYKKQGAGGTLTHHRNMFVHCG